MSGRSLALLLAAALLLVAGQAAAEPTFLSKDYPRCTSCHFSPTGGGLLNDFGRTMSHTVLPTFPAASGADATAPDGEQAFLYGALGDALGDARLGVALRPSHLRFGFPGGSADRNLLMQADLQAAYRRGALTLYADIGRHPEGDGGELGSYEHWVSYQAASGLTVRAGRFLPAYGVKLADHTSFNRRTLGFGESDQVYGVEVSRSAGSTLVQVAVAPGRADAIIDDDGTRAFAATGRVQVDVAPRTVVVASGAYRASSDLGAASGSGGLALGLAPLSRLALWTQVDALGVDGAGTSVVVVHEASFEAYRGVWLKLSPQFRTGNDAGASDTGRLVFGATLLPRTHWNVNLTYARDHNYDFDVSTDTLMAQLHLFL